MSFRKQHLALLLMPMLLSACGPSDDHIYWESRAARRTHLTAQVLNQRIEVLLAADVAAHRAAVQPLLDGTQVTFIDTAPTPGGPAVSDRNEGSVRASFVQAMLDPTLMRMELTDTSPLPEDQRQERLDNLADFLRSYGLGPIIVPSTQHFVMPSDTTKPMPPGLTVTIAVFCPNRYDGAGYGSGKAQPACF